MTLPLERFRMLDLTRLVPGPMAGQPLSVNLDALEGEARSNGWDHTHRNKRSIAINLQKPEGQAIFHRLVADKDLIALHPKSTGFTLQL